MASRPSSSHRHQGANGHLDGLTYEDLFGNEVEEGGYHSDESYAQPPPPKNMASPAGPLQRARRSGSSSTRYVADCDDDLSAKGAAPSDPPKTFVETPKQAAFAKQVAEAIARMRTYNKALEEYNSKMKSKIDLYRNDGRGGTRGRQYSKVAAMSNNCSPPKIQMAPKFFLTGVPGSGKSATVNALRQTLADHLDPNVDTLFPICASTAMAASVYNGGKTVHSLLGLGKGDQSPSNIPKHVSERVEAMEVLFLDELSMIHPTTLEVIDHVLKKVKRTNLPFGNVIVVFIGDFLQLPPVITDKDPLLAAYGGKLLDVPVLFETKCWMEAVVQTHYLDYSFRQQVKHSSSGLADEVDVFLKLLAKVRMAKMDENSLRILAARVIPLETFKAQYAKEYGEEVVASIEPTMLLCRRTAVDSQNAKKLNEIASPPLLFAGRYLSTTLPWKELSVEAFSSNATASVKGVVLDEFIPSSNKWGEVLPSLRSVDAKCDYGRRAVAVTRNPDGDFRPTTLVTFNNIAKDASRVDIRTPFFLHLKVGAQVVCTVNHSSGFPVNGSKGVVVDFLTPDEFTYQWRDNRRIIDEDDEAMRIVNGLGADPCDDPTCPYASDTLDANKRDERGGTDDKCCWWHYISCTRWPVVKFLGGRCRLMKPALIQVGSSQVRLRKDGPAATELHIQCSVPLRLAWADTIHAAQGQTCVYGYIFPDNRMEFGQFYVAISRFPSLKSFALEKFDVHNWKSFIKAHPRIVEFYEKEEAKTREALLLGL